MKKFWEFVKRFFGFGGYDPLPKNERIWRYQESELLERINRYRVENNRLPLKKEDSHYRLADERVLDCFEEGGISHSKFPLVVGFLEKLNFRYPSENLGYGQKDGTLMFEAWKKSPGHNRNILGNYKYTGICLKRDHRGVLYGCQIFSK